MARLEGDSSNELIQTLLDWDACLQRTSLIQSRPDAVPKPPEPAP